MGSSWSGGWARSRKIPRLHFFPLPAGRNGRHDSHHRCPGRTAAASSQRRPSPCSERATSLDGTIGSAAGPEQGIHVVSKGVSWVPEAGGPADGGVLGCGDFGRELDGACCELVTGERQAERDAPLNRETHRWLAPGFFPEGSMPKHFQPGVRCGPGRARAPEKGRGAPGGGAIRACRALRLRYRKMLRKTW